MKVLCLSLYSMLIAVLSFAQVNSKAPYLRNEAGATQLIVHDKPFLMLGGELGNSTASNPALMQPAWTKFKSMNMNTVLSPVYWELIEPQESTFDFSTVDSMITNARTNGMKLVFLWFGTWKNSMSCYVPAWMKTNPTRFSRTQDKNGRSQEILSAFDNETLAADKKAFTALMKHIKSIDAVENTVLMIQVENEIGMLPTAREFSKTANDLFAKQVPQELVNYFTKNRETLVPELKTKWDANSNKTKGSWAEIFGADIQTDEMFQAWYYAKYTNEVAAAGKKEYDIPMYVNAALPRKGKLPGEYPSAGPLPHIMDIWKAAAPFIDILSPDFYNPDTKYWCDLYAKKFNPLFVPEMHLDASCAAKVFFIVGHYKALGFSPFSIENASPEAGLALGKSYNLIGQLSGLLLSKKVMAYDGVLIDKGADTQRIKMGSYIIKLRHDYTLGWSPGAKDSIWPSSGAIIMQTADNEFIFLGTGVVATFENIDQAKVTNILSVDEIKFVNGEERILLRLNGDEDHQGRHMRIPGGEWQLQKVKLYDSPAKIE